ncbi:carbohydrate-binding protein (plasmid) [Aestuarium zhoushanense]|nr:carbohydrate-binding protein [Aestuarium zhoushanense]
MRIGVLYFLVLLAFPANAEVREILPGPDTLRLAIEQAASGDTLVLLSGEYTGPVTIDRPLTLTGDSAIINGPNEGTVVSVTAPDVTINGLIIRGAGARLDKLDSGIALSDTADNAVITGNHLQGNLIGVDVQGASGVTVSGNLIEGRNDLRVPERGPGIYVWNAPDLLVEGNTIRMGRDGIFVTTSNRATYRDNDMSDLRFAFHSMYANDITLIGNTSHGNDMGFAFMYSNKVYAMGNLSDGDTTHGFFMNFVNHADLTGNEVRSGGEQCLFIYNSNRNHYEGNRFAGCDIGVHYTAGSQDNVLTKNAFIGNRTQVKYVGTRWLEWAADGTGNYWSDHAGFDINGDGVTDSPYRPNDIVDQVIWSQPMARMLVGSPAVQLISWSQSRFPGLLPGGVSDPFPLSSPGAAGLTYTQELTQ